MYDPFLNVSNLFSFCIPLREYIQHISLAESSERLKHDQTAPFCNFISEPESIYRAHVLIKEFDQRKGENFRQLHHPPECRTHV